MKLPRAHHMSPEALAGQILMPVFKGRFQNRNTPSVRKFCRVLHQLQIGGVIFFHGSPVDVQYWTQIFQKESTFPMFFGADLERGLGSVLSQGTRFPHAMALGAGDSEQAAQDFAEVLATEARSVGINVFFGPVLDLADHPQNPIINIRAYHSDPAVAGQIGNRIISTVQKHGIACTGKHFPGHGPTSVDSHDRLPRLSKSITELNTRELLPFQDAIHSDVKAVLAGHLLVKGASHPASMEKTIIDGLLRKQMKFNGVVFTDALEMGAIQKSYTLPEQLFLPIAAGVDVLLMPVQLPLAHRLLVERITADEDFRYQAEQAVERIFRLKRWLHTRQPKQAHPHRVYKVVEHPNHIGLANRAAEQAMTLLHHSRRFPLYLPGVEGVDHFIFTDTLFTSPPLQRFNQLLEEESGALNQHVNPSQASVDQVAASSNNLAVVSLYFRTFANHLQKLDWETVRALLKRLNEQRRTAVVFLFGNPHQAAHLKDELKHIDAFFLTYSYVAASQQAAFKALCSFIPIRGQAPISLPKMMDKSLSLPVREYTLTPVVSGKYHWQPLTELLQEAIDQHIFPGCSVAIARKGQLLHWKGYGQADYQPGAKPITPDTSYDLASLTKVLATTPALMRLSDQGALHLDNPLKEFYPSLDNQPQGQITLRDILAHRSGWPAWKPLYTLGIDRHTIIREILKTDLAYPTGSQTVYSDLGFIILGDIVERVSGRQLDEFCRNEFYRRMGLNSLQFTPQPQRREAFPPTGRDSLRMGVIRGEVNDTNAFAMGGVAGHAGLFGHAADVAAMGQMFLQGGIYHRQRLISRSTMKTFLQRVDHEKDARALGWDVPGKKSSAGTYFSPNTIGHLGFTGTSIWIDRRREIVVVLLSNRVHPSSEPNPMPEFRPRFHNLVMEILLGKTT